MCTATSTATTITLKRKGITIEELRWSLTEAALAIHTRVTFAICAFCTLRTALCPSARWHTRLGLNPSRRVEPYRSDTCHLFCKGILKKQV